MTDRNPSLDSLNTSAIPTRCHRSKPYPALLLETGLAVFATRLDLVKFLLVSTIAVAASLPQLPTSMSSAEFPDGLVLPPLTLVGRSHI
jgi:hypothetical protein